MKNTLKFITLLFSLIALVSIIVYSTDSEKSTSAIWKISENASVSINSSVNEVLYYGVNKTIDGNYSSYALMNGTILRNYTKPNTDVLKTTVWQVKYNATGGIVTTTNHTIPDVCWDYDEDTLAFKINMTYNKSHGSNAHYCFNGSWTLIGDVQTEAAVFEEAVWYRLRGRNYALNYSIAKPAAYYTSDTAAVNFSLLINDTLADVNHTTFNCSLFLKTTSAESYTGYNESRRIYNNTFDNGTIHTFSDGDRVWWKWSCQDNFSRIIFNTTERIMDVDVDYYVLSLGASKVINFSLGTGEILTKGGMTAANYTAGTSAGFTGQLNATFCNLTIVGGIITGYVGCDVG